VEHALSFPFSSMTLFEKNWQLLMILYIYVRVLPGWLWFPTNLLFIGYQEHFSPGVKQLECENDNVSPVPYLHGMVFNREDFYMLFCSLKGVKHFVFYFMCCGNESALSSAAYTVTSFLES
jgi:hypothetical protein